MEILARGSGGNSAESGEEAAQEWHQHNPVQPPTFGMDLLHVYSVFF